MTPTVLFRGVAAACCLTAGACANRGPASDPAADDVVTVQVATDRSLYRAGTPVAITLTVRNDGAEPLTLPFTSSQRYDFVIVDTGGTVVWTWSAARGFLHVTGEETLAPGEVREFGETYADALPPGRYFVRGILAAADRPRADQAAIEVQ